MQKIPKILRSVHDTRLVRQYLSSVIRKRKHKESEECLFGCYPTKITYQYVVNENRPVNKLRATFSKIRRKKISGQYHQNIRNSVCHGNVFCYYYYLFNTPHVILLFSFVYECIKRAQCDNNSKSEIIIYWSSWKTKATWYHYTGIRVFYSLCTIISLLYSWKSIRNFYITVLDTVHDAAICFVNFKSQREFQSHKGNEVLFN